MFVGERYGLPAWETRVAARGGADTREPAGLTELTEKITESGARGKTKGALSGAAETIFGAYQQARDEGRQRQGARPARRRDT